MSADPTTGRCKIVHSKMAPPHPLARHLPRTITGRVIEALRGWRAVFLSSPIGYGKTTVLADTRRSLISNNGPCTSSWVTFDDADTLEERRPWAHLLSALARLYPNAATRTAEEYLQGTIDKDRALEEISDALWNLADSDSTALELLILDDISVLETGMQAEMLDFLLRALPSSGRVLAAAAPFCISCLGYRHMSEVCVFGLDDMTLGRAESIALARTAARGDLPPQTVYDIADTANGWAMGIALLAGESRPASGPTARGESDDDSSPEMPAAPDDLLENQLVSMFFESYVASLPADLGAFCLDASVVSILCEDLCKAIVGDEHGSSLFHLLAGGGMLAAPCPGLEGWVAFHPMLLRWLRRRFAQTGTIHARRVCQHACSWFESKSMPSQAAKFMAMGSDYEFIGNLVSSLGFGRTFGPGGFLLWAMEAEPDSLAWDVTLNLYAIWAYYFAGDADRTMQWTNNLAGLLSQSTFDRLAMDDEDRHIAPLTSMLDLVSMKCEQYRGDYDKSLEGLTALVEPGEGLIQELQCLAWHALGEAQERMGRLAPAQASYLHANGVAIRAGSTFFGVFSRFSLAWVQAHRRELVKAEQTCLRALEECPPVFSLYGSLHVLLAYIHIQEDDTDKAVAELEVARNSFANGGNADMLLECDTVRSLALAAQGDIDEAYRNIVGAITPHADTGMPRGVLQFAYYTQFRLAIGREDAADAAAALSNLEVATPSWDLWFNEAARFARAKLLQMDGDLRSATLEAASIVSRSRELGFAEHELDALLLLASIASETGDKKTAEEHILEALHLGSIQKAIAPFLNAGQAVLELLFSIESVHGATSLARLYARNILSHVRKADITKRENVSTAVAIARLSTREREVLALLNQGYSRSAIAEKLCVSVNTVKTHLGHIYGKLGVDGRSGAFSASLFDESTV